MIIPYSSSAAWSLVASSACNFDYWILQLHALLCDNIGGVGEHVTFMFRFLIRSFAKLFFFGLRRATPVKPILTINASYDMLSRRTAF